MALPAAGYFVLGLSGTNGSTALNDWLACTRQYLGTQDETELTISSGSVTAAVSMHTIDTESDAATDTLTNIVISAHNGFLIMVRAENAARVVTMTHEAGGAGQLSFLDAQDCVLDSTDKRVWFWLDTGASPTTLREIARFGFGDLGLASMTAVTTGPTTLTVADSGRIYHNDGAGAQTDYTLPAAEAGLEFRFVSLEAFAIQVTAQAGDTIRDGATESGSGGETQCSGAKGNAIHLVCFNAAEWVAVSKQGTWTTT